MRWRDYLRISRETKDGMFFCGLCGGWVDKQRWAHFKGVHKRGRVRRQSQGVLPTHGE